MRRPDHSCVCVCVPVGARILIATGNEYAQEHIKLMCLESQCFVENPLTVPELIASLSKRFDVVLISQEMLKKAASAVADAVKRYICLSPFRCASVFAFVSRRSVDGFCSITTDTAERVDTAETPGCTLCASCATPVR